MRNLAALVLLLMSAPPAAAQVTHDGSLGPAGAVPLVAGEYAIGDDIREYSGVNLFHSFSRFDVGTGETAAFSASLGAPKRVIVRVTGGDRSDINGRLRSTIPNADLFLLNASGVSLGSGAQLEIDGSFYTSTADVLRFASGPDFVVADATPSPLLSAAPPAAFGFVSASPALIEVARTNKLAVPAGKTLSIVGGDVFVTGDPIPVVPPILIESPGSRLEIAAAAGPVDIPVALGDLDMDAVKPGTLGVVDVLGATLNLSGVGETPSGSVTIRAGRFVLEGKSRIIAKNNANAQPAVGPVDIAVTGDGIADTPDLLLTGTQVQIQSWSAGNARAGDVLLSGDEIELSGGAQVLLFNGGDASHTGSGPDAWIEGRRVELENGDVQVLSLSAGPASSVTILASEEISLADGAQVVSELLFDSPGPGGILRLEAPSVVVAQDAQLSTLAGGSGEGARIEVDSDTLTVEDGGGILSQASSTGPGGVIDLEVESLVVTDAGRITSGTEAGEAGGPIEIRADRVQVSNAAGRPESTFISADNGGSLTLEADLVELLDGGQILTRTFTGTPAGALRIVGAERVSAKGVDAQDRPAGLFSRTRESATASGTGGLLSVETRVLEVDDGGELSSSTLGPAAAGAMEIHASERVSVRGGPNGVSLISAAALPGSSGDGGSIRIGTDPLAPLDLLELRDGGQITTSTFGSGAGGVIDAHARVVEISGVDPLSRLNPSGFFSRSNNAAPDAGDGGSIGILATQGLWMRDGALVSASSSGPGLAGDVLVDGGARFEMQGSRITTEALLSAGGNVKVAADVLVYLNGSSISTDVLGGLGGGGDVSVDPVNTVLNHSNITARAEFGEGGNIQIVSDHFFQSGDSFLSASSEFGIDGTVEIVSPVTDLTGALAQLPASYLDAAGLLASECAARTERAGSFAVRARGPLPAPSDAVLTPTDGGARPLAEKNP